MLMIRAAKNQSNACRGRAAGALACLVTLASVALAQPVPASKSAPSSAALRTARAFEAARKESPLALRAFLWEMPKGADLHIHLSGAVYAESFIKAAAEDGLCVDKAALAFVEPKEKPKSPGQQPACADGQVTAAEAFSDQHLYDALIDSFSMRSFVASTGTSGHDHFFDTFDKFGGTEKYHKGEWIDEIATHAAMQNEQYLELMETPEFKHAATIAHQLGWNDNLEQMRKDLLDRGLRDEVPADREYLAQALERRNQIEHCGQPDAAAACRVTVRFIYQVLRGFPKEQVFAQTLLGFEVASVDPDVVGINFVMPEDGYLSMKDYRAQMRMVGYLHSVYPKVHITLHAGELAPGLVTPEGLTFHIRSAVEQGHAERIGHGVDIMYEEHPFDLLKEMAAKHVMVEINLTSNDVILGVKGADHPLPLYRKYGVPVALSTDDEGVSRIDLTGEYLRAAESYNLGYADLKQMARTGIEHAFLSGASVWESTARQSLDRPVAACRSQLGNAEPKGACADLVHRSEKAQQEWELERRFHNFEATH
jgi:adenosine deaminase